MTYERVTCYYLSGTGNSYRAASWLAEAAAEKGATAELIPIAAADPKKDLMDGARQLVGIYHPTHGLMPPWSMIKFLVRLPWGRGAHACVVATRGGFPIPPVVIPGGAGMALFFPFLVLLLKGYRLRGGVGIDMPCNLINIHWGFKPKNVDHIIAWGKRRHQGLVDAVLSNRRYVHPINLLWEIIWCIPFLLLPLFPIAYLTVGRLFMAKLMFVDTSCRGCGACARHCPSKAIAMVGRNPKTPFWTYHCEVCLRCMGYCKFQSIQAAHLWLLPVIYGTSFLSASLITNLIATVWNKEISILSPVTDLLTIFTVYLSLPIFYYLFFGLQKLRPMRTLFTYTTLTKFYSRRYQAPDTTAREMTRRSSYGLHFQRKDSTVDSIY